MTTRKANCLLLSFALALLAMVSARAQSTGVYLGLGAGKSSGSFNTSDFNLNVLGVAESADKNSTGGKVFAGVRFHRNFAAEISYVDLGKFRYSYRGAPATGTADIDYKVSGYTVSGAAILPVSEEFSLFARVGAFASTAKASVSNATGVIFSSSSGVSDSARKTSLYFGAGAQYDFLKRFGVRIEYEDYGEVGDSDTTGRVKVSLISGSLLFRF